MMYSSHNSIVYENEAGLYQCDERGMLMAYYPSIDNLMDKSVVREHYTYGDVYYRPCVKRLVIPEGVKSLCAEFFRFGYIEEALILPNSLECIGSQDEMGVFANTHLPKVVLPDSVKTIGIFAFGNSRINHLVLPRGNKSIYARQFKDAQIDTLCVSQEEWQHPDNDSYMRNFFIHVSYNKLELF